MMRIFESRISIVDGPDVRCGSGPVRGRIAFCVLLLLFAFAPALAAQTDPKPPANPATARLDELEKEIRELRARLDQRDAKERDDALRIKALIQVYGDIGLRYHGLFESQTETTNRPEFRLHLGAFGTTSGQGPAHPLQPAHDHFHHRWRGPARANRGVASFPGFGGPQLLAADRFLIDYTLEKVFTLTAGRFPSPYAGGELLFDSDYNLQGLGQTISFDRLFKGGLNRWMPRLELQFVSKLHGAGQPGHSQPLFGGLSGLHRRADAF